MPLRERKYAPAGFFYEAINLTLPGEYALSLKRERWRARHDEKGATFLWGFASPGTTRSKINCYDNRKQ